MKIVRALIGDSSNNSIDILNSKKLGESIIYQIPEFANKENKNKFKSLNSMTNQENQK